MFAVGTGYLNTGLLPAPSHLNFCLIFRAFPPFELEWRSLVRVYSLTLRREHQDLSILTFFFFSCKDEEMPTRLLPHSSSWILSLGEAHRGRGICGGDGGGVSVSGTECLLLAGCCAECCSCMASLSSNQGELVPITHHFIDKELEPRRGVKKLFQDHWTIV